MIPSRYNISTVCALPPDLPSHECDDYTIAGHLEFSKLVLKGVRFQVSLSSPVNVEGNTIEPSWRAAGALLYESTELTALKQVQKVLFTHVLFIQWDMASGRRRPFPIVVHFSERRPWRQGSEACCGCA